MQSRYLSDILGPLSIQPMLCLDTTNYTIIRHFNKEDFNKVNVRLILK